jgi:hypothetical protein
MSANANEKQADSSAIMPSLRPLDWTKYKIITEERGSIDATRVVTIWAIMRMIASSYSKRPVPRCSETGRLRV